MIQLSERWLYIFRPYRNLKFVGVFTSLLDRVWKESVLLDALLSSASREKSTVCHHTPPLHLVQKLSLSRRLNINSILYNSFIAVVVVVVVVVVVGVVVVVVVVVVVMKNCRTS